MCTLFPVGEIRLSSVASWNQTGITIAGGFNQPSGFDSFQLNQSLGLSIIDDDVLYIGDSGNHRIVVIHLRSTTRNFTIGSGPGFNSTQFHYPFDVFATDTSLYVLDSHNKRIEKLSLNGSDRTTVLKSDELHHPIYLSLRIQQTLQSSLAMES